jgi:hypothetical protein
MIRRADIRAMETTPFLLLTYGVNHEKLSEIGYSRLLEVIRTKVLFPRVFHNIRRGPPAA